jgi:predicted 3-demethylubiquinone-9 3-methyltransferase (glyoxalase superfamily)
MPKMTTCLWFDGNAEEAARFYASIFKDSKIGTITRYGQAGHEVHGREAGSVMTVEVEIAGQGFVALNGGPLFKFNESISFQIHCETQAEIDYYWARLSEGGDPKAQQCGWLKDKFGLSWQIGPAVLPKLLQTADATGADRIMAAVLQMKKLDIAGIERAARGD